MNRNQFCRKKFYMPDLLWPLISSETSRKNSFQGCIDHKQSSRIRGSVKLKHWHSNEVQMVGVKKTNVIYIVSPWSLDRKAHEFFRNALNKLELKNGTLLSWSLKEDKRSCLWCHRLCNKEERKKKWNWWPRNFRQRYSKVLKWLGRIEKSWSHLHWLCKAIEKVIIGKGKILSDLMEAYCGFVL